MGLLFGLSSVLFMNSGPVINKFILRSSSPIFSALINALLSFIFFKTIDCIKSRSLKFHISLNSLVGGIFNGFGLVLLFLALQHVHPAIIGFVGRLGIVFAMILATIFLNQRPDRAEICLGLVAILGAMGSVLHDGTDSSVFGFFLAVGSTLSFSVSNLCFKLAARRHSSAQILSSSYLVSAIMLFIFCTTSSEPVRYATDLKSWGLIIAGALFSSCLGFWCYLESLKYLTFSRATLLRATGPLFTVAMSYPFFGLQFSAGQITSASILLLSVILLALHEKSQGTKNLTLLQVPGPR